MFLGNCRSVRVVAASFLCLATVAAPGCRPARPGESQEVLPELKLEGVRFRVHRGETLRLAGEAESVTFRRDSTELLASGLSARVPSPGGVVEIAAPEGRGIVSERSYFATGGVRVSRGTDLVTTASARWEPSGRGGRLTGDDPVVVEGRGYRLEGTGFSLDPATSEIVIRGDARLVAGRGIGR